MVEKFLYQQNSCRYFRLLSFQELIILKEQCWHCALMYLHGSKTNHLCLLQSFPDFFASWKKVNIGMFCLCECVCVAASGVVLLVPRNTWLLVLACSTNLVLFTKLLQLMVLSALWKFLPINLFPGMILKSIL